MGSIFVPTTLLSCRLLQLPFLSLLPVASLFPRGRLIATSGSSLPALGPPEVGTALVFSVDLPGRDLGAC